MTALGKGRGGSIAGKRKHKAPPIEEVYLSEEDEEGEDQSVQDESVTRCTCGESHSVGLMVQCDQCEVWQHCECMGLMEEQDIPDQYYCEQCRPSDHIELKVGFEKTRRYYKPALPSDFEKKLALPKRRTTFNSREASDSWEEILALQTAIEQSKTESASPETPTLQHFKEPENEQDFDDMESDPSSRPQKRPVKKQKLNKKTIILEKKSKVTAVTPRKPNTVARQKKVARSRTSTPQPERKATPPPPTVYEFVRETSPPAKVCIPSPRMTISDMYKRANHILDIICSMDTTRGASSESDSDENRGRRRRPTPILIPEKMDDPSSPSSSLSSASTIPLEEEESDALIGEKGVAQEVLERMQRHKEETSTDIRMLLTTDIINFTREYASSSCEDEEGDCRPTTRSRELSHRSYMERVW
ncbi:hypothetical protein K501DRAFT_282968 [Backusella circina FSU 941]|nr:hypothetical protein K501DRAFT_282968 [Backusella circina FSU 941]